MLLMISLYSLYSVAAFVPPHSCPDCPEPNIITVFKTVLLLTYDRLRPLHQIGEPEHITRSWRVSRLQLCVYERRGTVLKTAHFWQLCHPETPLQAESHNEAAKEHFY